MKPVWQGLRILRWLLMLSFFGYLIYLWNEGGRLTRTMDLVMFALGMGAVAASMFEMAARDMADVPRKPPRK